MQFNCRPSLPMLRSRLFMLMLAVLLIAQSVLGTALHRCHDGMQLMIEHDVATLQDQAMPCHNHDMDSAGQKSADIGNSHITAQHGICTCAIAHCTPGLISPFELPSMTAHAITVSLYRFVIPIAPTETLLRPPIALS